MARDIGIEEEYDPTIIENIIYLRIDDREKLIISNGDSWRNNFLIYQNTSSHIRGSAATFINKKGYPIGYIPPMETEETYKKRVELLNAINKNKNYKYVVGPLEVVMEYIDSLYKLQNGKVKKYEKNDVSYLNADKTIKFNYRVALLAVHNNKILLQKDDRDDYYSLIGGRVHLLEDSNQAIIREVKEETGIELNLNDVKLIKVVENFFKYDNINFHELLFVYKVDSVELYKKDNFKTLDKDNVINKWYNIQNISNMDIRPEFIKNCYNDDILKSIIINSNS